MLKRLGWLLRVRLEDEPGILWRCAVALLAILMKLHASTVRYAINDKAGYFSGALDCPVILVTWHNRIFGAPAMYARFSRRRRGAAVLTSAGREGSLLTLLMSKFRMGAVRGSRSRRGFAALRELAAEIRAGGDVILTPDGSRGPRYLVQPGAIFLAHETGAPIVPVHLEYSRYLRFRTWDGFVLPSPFARFEVIFDEPFRVAAGQTAVGLEEHRLRLEQIMTDALLMDRTVAPE